MSSYAELTLVTDDEQARELSSHHTGGQIAASVLRNAVRQLESEIRELGEEIISLRRDQKLLITRRDACEHAAHTLDPEDLA